MEHYSRDRELLITSSRVQWDAALMSCTEHVLNRNSLTVNCSGVSIVHVRLTHTEQRGRR